VSKFLLNLLVQISKALINSKIQFLFLKGISFSFWPNRPNRLGLTRHGATALSAAPHPTLFPLPLPLPSIRGVKHQLRVSRFIPINAGHSSALITTLPLSPYIKGELRRSPPHLSPLSFSSLRAQAPPAPSASSTISSPLSPAPR
jgi:hypothetical protein